MATQTQLSRTSEVEALFRPEVIETQTQRLHGAIILRPSASTRIVTAGITVIVAAAVAWMMLGHYARIETVPGMLVPSGGYAKIQVLRPGVVTSLRVNDGDAVKAGDTLATVRTESPNASGRIGTQDELRLIDGQMMLATEQIGLSDQRARGEVARLDGIADALREQGEAVEAQIRYHEQIIASMIGSFEQITPVVERGYISKHEFERRRQALLGAQEELVRLRQQKGAIDAEIVRNRGDRNQAVVAGRTERASARAALESLRREQTRTFGENSYAVDAPVAGRVTALQTGVGRTVEGSVPMMVLVPEHAPLRADIFVPSRAIGFVKRGQEVRLLYDAFPYQRFGSHRGRIKTISRLAISGPETGAPFQISEPVYRVTVLLDRQDVWAYGERVTLQPGMTLAANIILERQSFLDWMLDPLRSVTNRT